MVLPVPPLEVDCVVAVVSQNESFTAVAVPLLKSPPVALAPVTTPVAKTRVNVRPAEAFDINPARVFRPETAPVL